MAHDGHDLKTIDLQNIKIIVDTILDRMINELEIRKVCISDDQDFYWDLNKEDVFKVKEKQPDLGVGRLSDDWEFLQSILKDREHAVSLMLIHVAPLLRFIGEKFGQ
jgi:arginine repressor